MATFDSPREILLVDDDTELVALLADYLTLEGFKVSATYNGKKALDILSKRSFDLLILDVMMPEMNGVDLLKEIRKSSQVPVLMLTAKGDPIDRILGLELGADDYVPKPCPPRELVARINAILRRVHKNNPIGETIEIGPLTLTPALRLCQSPWGPIELTGTEFSLLEYLSKNLGEPVSKEDLYPAILSRPMTRYDRAIDVHVSSVRQKLHKAIGDLISLDSIRGVGYQLTLHKD